MNGFFLIDLNSPWWTVLILISAGVAVAFQIGKIPAALASIQAELSLSLVQSGWVVAIFSLMAAVSAVLLGFTADRFGHLNIALVGMALTSIASLAGGFSQDATTLLVSRVIEGLGFLMTVTAIPPLIMHAIAPSKHRTALALWGLYIPVGSFLLMMLSKTSA